MTPVNDLTIVATICHAIEALTVQRPAMTLEASKEALHKLVCIAAAEAASGTTIAAAARQALDSEHVQRHLPPWQ